MTKQRRVFGPAKYAAFHLLVARWLRHIASPLEHQYVTLGGTELRDVQSLWFVDRLLVESAISYEQQTERALLAGETATQLSKNGLPVRVEQGNFFDFDRQSDVPHVFFLDLEGTCAAADFRIRFGTMFQRETLRENDTLLVTSYLGRNPGWEKVLGAFDAEFRVLGIQDTESKKRWYRRAHPSFTLFSALTQCGLESDLSLVCFGCVEYRDTSTMGLYGYSLRAGKTSLQSLTGDTNYYSIKLGMQ